MLVSPSPNAPLLIVMVLDSGNEPARILMSPNPTASHDVNKVAGAEFEISGCSTVHPESLGPARYFGDNLQPLAAVPYSYADHLGNSITFSRAFLPTLGPTLAYRWCKTSWRLLQLPAINCTRSSSHPITGFAHMHSRVFGSALLALHIPGCAVWHNRQCDPGPARSLYSPGSNVSVVLRRLVGVSSKQRAIQCTAPIAPRPHHDGVRRRQRWTREWRSPTWLTLQASLSWPLAPSNCLAFCFSRRWSGRGVKSKRTDQADGPPILHTRQDRDSGYGKHGLTVSTLVSSQRHPTTPASHKLQSDGHSRASLQFHPSHPPTGRRWI